jgi:hypothetical protein
LLFPVEDVSQDENPEDEPDPSKPGRRPSLKVVK